MQNKARGFVAATFVAVLAAGLSGCAAASGPDLATCAEVIPEATVADIYGDEKLVQLGSVEEDPVSALVDTIVTNGVACGVDDSEGGVVFIGQLVMDKATWTSTREGLVSDPSALEADDFASGAVITPKTDEDLAYSAGFAWSAGILYYARPSMIFSLVPALHP